MRGAELRHRPHAQAHGEPEASREKQPSRDNGPETLAEYC